MIKTSSFILILLSSTFVMGQTKYFKDIDCKNPTIEKKAKYKKETSIADSIKTIVTTYLKNGVIVSKDQYKRNDESGEWKYFTNELGKEGQRNESITYARNKIEGAYYFDVKENKDSTFTPAHYKTLEEFYKFIGSGLRYPELARESGIQGKVYVHLKIDATGKCIPIGIYKGLHESLDFESIRIFNKMPNWTPSKKNGKAIDSYTIIPVNFRIG